MFKASSKDPSQKRFDEGFNFEYCGNYKKAAKSYEISAKLGNSNARCALGILYEEGKGVRQDYSRAIELYTLAESQGHKLACARLGLCYYYGRGVGRDIGKATEYLLKYDRLDAYCSEAKDAIDFCRKARENRAATNPAEPVKVQEQTTPNVFDTPAYVNIKPYIKSEEENKAPSPETTEPDPITQQDAKKLFEIFDMATRYYEGEGVEKDCEKAAKLFALLAKLGISEAEYNLSVCYQTGSGVPKSEAKAIELLTRSADHGFATAQKILAMYYFNGEKLPQNYKLAFKYSKMAADSGDALAQCILGQLYFAGLGTEESVMQAKYWLLKSADAGCEQAKDFIKAFLT